MPEPGEEALRTAEGARLDDVGVAGPALRVALHDYFAWATTNSMAAYPDSADDVPGDLRIPRWPWEGLRR